MRSFRSSQISRSRKRRSATISTAGLNSASSTGSVPAANDDLLFRSRRGCGSVKVAIPFGHFETRTLKKPVYVRREILLELVVYGCQYRSGIGGCEQAPIYRQDTGTGIIKEIFSNLEGTASFICHASY